MDLVKDPLPALIRKIALPAGLGFLFNTLYNVTDTFWGGQISGEALAALGLSFPLFLLLMSLGIGLGSGSAALIGNALGAGEAQGARRTLGQSFTLGIMAWALAALPLFVFLPLIFRFFGAEGSLLVSALAYGRVIILGSLPLVLNQILNSALTARGDTKAFRNFLILGFFLNLVLDPVLAFGVNLGGWQIIPALGEAGIAWATVLIQGIGTVYLWRRVRRDPEFGRLRSWGIWPLDPALVKEIITQSLPPALNMMLIAGGIFVINYYASRFGAEAVAAYSTAVRIEQIALLPTIGLNIALGSLVAQNNGARRTDRVREAFRITLVYGLVIMAVVLPPVLFFGRHILSLFTDQESIRNLGYEYLLIQGLTFFSYILMSQANAVLQGIKRPGMIFWVGMYRQLAAPLAIFPLLSYGLGLGISGIWWGLVFINWSGALFTWWEAHRQQARQDRALAELSSGAPVQ